MATYIRRYGPRDGLESVLVVCLAECGIQVQLSTDFEDEMCGIDAWDLEHEIPIDIHLDTHCANVGTAKKAIKDLNGQVAIFEIPCELAYDLALPSQRARLLPKLLELYTRFIRCARSRRERKYLKLEETYMRYQTWATRAA